MLRRAGSRWRAVAAARAAPRHARGQPLAPALLATRAAARHCSTRRCPNLQRRGAAAARHLSASPSSTDAELASELESAQLGTRVKVHYRGTSADGNEIESNVSGEPLEFLVGAGQVLRGVERGVQGMRINETRCVKLEPAEAYGEYVEGKCMTVAIDTIPDGTKAGDMVMFEDGKRCTVRELRPQAQEALLDLNHPLAGIPMEFELTLLSIEQPRPVEVKVLCAGNGQDFPRPGDQVTVEYAGFLKNSPEPFDSSATRINPLSFIIGTGQVVSGMEQGLLQMSLGEEAELFVPSEHAYGTSGAGEAIPPNADLTFLVKLVEITKNSL